jgi:hypothetical protein
MRTTPTNPDRPGKFLLAAVAAIASLVLAAAPASAADPNQGPGGPILVVSGDSNQFGRYYAEILRNEGLNEFDVTDLSNVTQPMLDSHDVVVLGETPLTPAQATQLSDWVQAGGNLIAMRPDDDLAGLLGLTDSGTTLADGYLEVDDSTPPGEGIVGEPIQYHGTADRYSLSGATEIAKLYSDATTPTTSPAVTTRSVGSNGGEAAAFTYDLARSVVLTRQGNPAWAGQDRDGIGPIRSNDLFYGNAAGDPQDDWVDLDKVDIPQADEQQRLLANMIGAMNLDRSPLPRFWYFPDGEKAAIVMTGDDHGNGGTVGRFNAEQAESTMGCSVADWQCVRSTSYIYPSTPITNAQASGYDAAGFELALHPDTGCSSPSAAAYDSVLAGQLNTFAANFPGVPAPKTNRNHCIAWIGWADVPKVEADHGIRLDANYYYWPEAWLQDRAGMFTGSGMPMRFADTDGSMIDVYQAATQMTDESGQEFPATVNALLDGALGAEGYYGAFTANMHTDSAFHPSWQAIVDSAQSHGVPVITARQLLEWTDARNESSYENIDFTAGVLSFDVSPGPGASRLQGMVPLVAENGDELAGLERNGNAVATATETIKGVEYAFFPATAGSYEATYEAAPPAAPEATHTTAADFNAGTHTGTHVTNDNGGEVILKPQVAEEFSGAGLPASFGYSGNWSGGGSQTVSGGSLNVDGGYAGTTGLHGSGRSLEFVATFPNAPFTHVGFGVDYDNDPHWQMFSVKGDGNFYARTNASGPETQLPSSLIGSPHRYRIEWGASDVRYYVDGALVATHNVSFGGTQLRPLVSEFNPGGASLSVDWLRMTPYASSGTYESAVIDAGEEVDWGALSWNADEPAGTSVALSVRVGGTPSPDGTWSAWAPVTASGDDVAASSRYAQYKADFATSNPEATAVLSDVTLGWSPVGSGGGDATQTTLADFEAGTRTGVHVIDDDGGEVILQPEVAEEFGGSGLPATFGFSGAWSGGGAANVGGGALDINGAYAGTTNLYGPGRTLEFVATFPSAPFTHVGFGVDYNADSRWLMFSVKGDGNLYARTNPGTETQLPSSLIGSPHRYRIEWGATEARYYVDGGLVATHSTGFPGGTQLRPLASEFNAGGPSLSVDWLRMTPYANSGTFTSSVIDAGATVQWGALDWTADEPAGTTLDLFVRTGDTASPDGTWSGWTPIAASGDDVPGSSRYAQYRAEFTTSDPQGTPVLRDVTLAWSAADTPPTAVNDSRTVNEDSPATAMHVLPNDLNADGGPITITSVNDAGTHGTVQITGGGSNVTYEPDPDYCNTDASGPGSGPDDTFTYTLNGGSTATVAVEVTCLPDSADTTDPEIDIRDPYEAGRYSIEADPKPELHADYDCSDADSGIASCVGTVADGALFDRSSPGTKTFTVTATDNAGNTATKTVTYRVFSFRNFMLDNGPIAYYRMGDAAGSQVMKAEVGPDGEYKNGQSSGPFGISGDGDRARLFTGADGYGYANNITAPRSYTLSAFFKLNDSGDAMILQHGSAGAIWHSGGMVRFRPVDWLGVELDSGAGSVTPGVWHQVAATYRWVPDPANPQLGTGTARLYLDGEHMDVRTADRQTSGTSTFYVGYGDKAPWLRGLVDEVAYYDKALSHTHLHEIWLADPPPPAEPTGGSGSGGTGGGGSGDPAPADPAPPAGAAGAVGASGSDGAGGGGDTGPADGGTAGAGEPAGIEIGTASAAGKWLTVEVTCGSDCEGYLSARKGSLKLGRGEFEAEAGDADLVQMKLTKKGGKAVKKGGSITVTLAHAEGEQTKTVALRRG